MQGNDRGHAITSRNTLGPKTQSGRWISEFAIHSGPKFEEIVRAPRPCRSDTDPFADAVERCNDVWRKRKCLGAVHPSTTRRV